MQNLNQSVGIAILGLGNAVKPHVAALHDLAAEGLITVSGVFSRDAAKRQQFATLHGFPAADSMEALVSDPRTHVVLILTPPNARADIVQQCLKHGKAMLMEKPVERTTDVAERFVAQAEAAGVPLGIVFQHRMRPAAMAFQALLKEKRLGEIALVRLMVPWWRSQSYYDEPGRGTLSRDGGGVLLSQAIHPLDLMLDLFGPVDTVQAMTGTTRLHSMETEDFATAGLRFVSGAFGSVVATTAAYPGAAEALSVDAEHGSATLQSGELVVHWRNGETERFGERAATGSGADPMAFDHFAHKAVIADFVRALSEKRVPAITGRSALAVHGLIDAFLLSSREGRQIDVKRAGSS